MQQYKYHNIPVKLFNKLPSDVNIVYNMIFSKTLGKSLVTITTGNSGIDVYGSLVNPSYPTTTIQQCPIISRNTTDTPIRNQVL